MNLILFEKRLIRKNTIIFQIEQFVSLIKHRQAPHYTTKHVMVMMGQRHGYFDAKLWFDNVDKLIQWESLCLLRSW